VAPLISTKDGFTLIEVLMAMLIMTVGLLGLLQSINVALEYNTKNQLREAAVHLGEEAMNDLRVQPFDNLKATPPPASSPVNRKVRGIDRSFTVERYAFLTGVNSDTMDLQVRVKWMYKNVESIHSVETYKSR
jgi:type IV pilus assembly protein PilV